MADAKPKRTTKRAAKSTPSVDLATKIAERKAAGVPALWKSLTGDQLEAVRSKGRCPVCDGRLIPGYERKTGRGGRLPSGDYIARGCVRCMLVFAENTYNHGDWFRYR